MEATVKKSMIAFLPLFIALLTVGSADAAPLFFPHVATSFPWQTEIAIINTSHSQTVTGTLRALSNDGQLVDSKEVTLSVHGRTQITVANEFTNHTNIGYIIFDTDSAMVRGYTKFNREGLYRAAIPAVTEVNTSDIYIPHIASAPPAPCGPLTASAAPRATGASWVSVPSSGSLKCGAARSLLRKNGAGPYAFLLSVSADAPAFSAIGSHPTFKLRCNFSKD